VTAARALKLAFGVAISALFLYATFRTVPFADLGAALAAAQPAWIAAAFGFVALAYALKIARWVSMLRSLGAAIGWREAATPFLGGVAFNNVLPFRAGDLIRVVAFQRFTGVPASGQLGTLVIERLLDLLVLMTILFAATTIWQVDALDPAWTAALQLASFGVVAAILLFILAPAPTRLLVRWAERRVPRLRPAGAALLRLIDAVQALSRPAFLVQVTALSLLAWLAEAGVYLAVGHALDVAASPEAALVAVSIGTLSTMIPSSPGYVGTFHFFTARTVAAFGATTSGAAAYAILVHAILWIATTASGFLLLALSGFGSRRPAAAAE
jgi:glycosyltransferase 2 family protein